MYFLIGRPLQEAFSTSKLSKFRNRRATKSFLCCFFEKCKFFTGLNRSRNSIVVKCKNIANFYRDFTSLQALVFLNCERRSNSVSAFATIRYQLSNNNQRQLRNPTDSSLSEAITEGSIIFRRLNMYTTDISIVFQML